jgi:transcriptional regulator with XRE-family HTH domain
MLMIGERIRQLRIQKGLSHDDVEKASGLLGSYISRVEHGRTVPSLETLERFASALEVPLYCLFFSGEDEPITEHLTPRRSLKELADEVAPSGTEARLVSKLKGFAGKANQT